MPPAARVGDMHVCPMVDPGPKPHVGGPILPPGCPTVLIGMMPAARVGDMATCVGPPDSIAQGSPTVQIGGMMSARIGDMTVHGGSITVGFPTVDIGMVGAGFPGSVTPLQAMSFERNAGGTVTGTFGPHVEIHGTPEFVSQTLGDLTSLSSLEHGQAVINSLNKTVHISEVAPGDQYASVASGDFSNPDLFNGTGVPATAGHSNEMTVIYGGSENWQHIPPHVALGHELTHASHITNGDLTTDPNTNATDTPAISVMHEERRTVGLPEDAAYGLPDYTGEPFSENHIRQDQGLPSRPRYTNSDW